MKQTDRVSRLLDVWPEVSVAAAAASCSAELELSEEILDVNGVRLKSDDLAAAAPPPPPPPEAAFDRRVSNGVSVR